MTTKHAWNQLNECGIYECPSCKITLRTNHDVPINSPVMMHGTSCPYCGKFITE